jgi:hypothetical protein
LLGLTNLWRDPDAKTMLEALLLGDEATCLRQNGFSRRQFGILESWRRHDLESGKYVESEYYAWPARDLEPI